MLLRFLRNASEFSAWLQSSVGPLRLPRWGRVVDGVPLIASADSSHVRPYILHIKINTSHYLRRILTNLLFQRQVFVCPTCATQSRKKELKDCRREYCAFTLKISCTSTARLSGLGKLESLAITHLHVHKSCLSITSRIYPQHEMG